MFKYFNLYLLILFNMAHLLIIKKGVTCAT